ncbi:MAG TPA: GNAT family N-acetyltransferase [Gammaproteobacteria bacterium]|nr:GNAT family N-acetyltransferase [Gammaproteobacteria bacterium]
MPTEWDIVPLNQNHERANFDCGEPVLNDYLARYARQNQKRGIARTFVAAPPSQPLSVFGYYSLTVGSLQKTDLPLTAVKRLPNFPVPIVRLARLAVELGMQGRGLGEDLLIDSLHRCLKIADEAGLFAVVLDAKHDRAKAFYARYEFEQLPDQPLTLWLPLTAIRRLFCE